MLILSSVSIVMELTRISVTTILFASSVVTQEINLECI